MLIQLETPLDTVQKAIELCVEFDTRVILNPAPATDLNEQIFRGTDIITPNETEAERLTGIEVKDEKDAAVAADRLHQLGVQTVIITLGSRGAYLSDLSSGEKSLIRGFKVSAVDTTAAGDVFNGQLAVALSEGKSFRHAVEVAHAAAALSVQNLGAQSSIPRREETDYFLEEHTKTAIQ
jgi:ribokinase